MVGIYSRYSNDELQRQASIEDQIRQCMDCAREKGWIVHPDYVRSDAGSSGETLATRSGLISLIEDAEKSRPIDGIVIDDTSRFGRNLGDVLQTWAVLRFHNVFLYFVNQGLDSRDSNFYQLIISYGAGDEQFISKLRNGVLRGQKGRILAGMIHGGRYYGYKHEVIPDPTRRGTIGRPAIKGVKLVVDEAEAAVVRRIFDWGMEGLSFQQIALKCVAEDFPRSERTNGAMSTWTVSTIGGMLHSELYRGRLIWGRTKSAKNPKTGRIVRRPKPIEEWTVLGVPELAIVSSKQWERVQEVIGGHKNFGLSRLGGMSRIKSATPPLFSGKLVCGICGNPIVITGGKNGDRIYQCREYRYRKACTNKVSILASVLEHRLIDEIVRRALQPEMLDHAIASFHKQLKGDLARELEESKRKRAMQPQLDREKRQLGIATRNIVDALRAYGPSPALLSELARVEARLKIVEEQRTPPSMSLRKIPLSEVREFVHSQAKSLAEILTTNGNVARLGIQTCFGTLTLTPEKQNGMPVYRVTGEVLPESKNVMPSDSRSGTRWHYGSFSIPFDVTVPALTKFHNFLAHPLCDASEVSRLIRDKKSVKEISQELRVSKFILRRVLKALNLRPTPKERVNYLAHPLCDASEVMRLRRQNKTLNEIAIDLGVSKPLVCCVFHALEAAAGVIYAPLRRRRSRRVDYRKHPKCDATEVMRLKAEGRPLKEIATELKVSQLVVSRVFHAVHDTPVT
jgi:DNA invertase Pin-like site-specific DNA recombinase